MPDREMGGKPPIILLPAIQHTGSQFVKHDILKDYQRITLRSEPSGPSVFYQHLSEEFRTDRFKTLIKEYPAIVSLRHPRRVFKGWKDRGKKLYQCMQEWDFIIEHIAPYNPYYMPIDSIDRDSYLGRIKQDLNIGHGVEWRPRGTVKGTMYHDPKDIVLDSETDKYIDSISWFCDRFWSDVVTETNVVTGVLFKNISNDRFSAYGYKWNPVGEEGDVQKVEKQSLIDKFRLYDRLEAIEFIEVEKEPKKEPGEVTIETLKSQAIAAGMKVDGRWSDKRLKEEIEKYIGDAQ